MPFAQNLPDGGLTNCTLPCSDMQVLLQPNQPLGGVPHYGGTDDHGTTAFRVMGDGPIPTPRKLVSMLDDWVIGQDSAKKVSLLCLALQT